MISSNINLHRLHRLCAGAAALLFFASGSLLAKTSTANVRGYVTGANGAPVTDAQVVARLTATNETRGTTTNAWAYYYMGGLRPGAYVFSARGVGVEPQTRSVDM